MSIEGVGTFLQFLAGLPLAGIVLIFLSPNALVEKRKGK